MTDMLNTAYGRNVKANMTAEETMDMLKKVGKTGMIALPYRVKKVDDNDDYFGKCATNFDDDGNAEGHDIEVTVLNDGVLAHELAHAVVHELYNYDELNDMNPHGSEFCEALTKVVKAMEAKS